MILFNLSLMLNQNLFNKYPNIIHQSNFIYSNNVDSTSSFLKAKNVPNITIIEEDFANKNLLSPNFITRVINKYWQETIFLSITDSVADTYINQLKSSGVTLHQNEYKKFLLDFSRALINGRIEVSLDYHKSIANIKNNSTYIKYIWRKGFNFPIPHKLFNFVTYAKGNYFPNNKQLALIKKMEENDFPLFIVINAFHQIVVAEPSDEMLSNNNFFDKLYKWYCNYTFSTKFNKPAYEGLFFINPEDALEYKEHIQEKYPESNKQNHISLFPSKLNLYYKLTRSLVPCINFRLVPDLKEISELLIQYRKYKHIFFHHQQKYGNNHFQGQPIYFIQPVFAFNKELKKVTPVNYSYRVSKNTNFEQYDAVFMNYKTAILAWQKFRKQAKNYNLPFYPKILVYNLEDFIKTCEHDSQIKERRLLFIPTKESYTFLKQRDNKKNHMHIFQQFSNSLLYLQVLGKRIVWSFTSRQPTNW